MCAHNRELLFGDITKGRMTLNRLGEIADESWRSLQTMFPNVHPNAWVVMSNHVHGILILVEQGMWVGDSRAAPTPAALRGGRLADMPGIKSAPLTRVVGTFKTISSKGINKIRGTPGIPV